MPKIPRVIAISASHRENPNTEAMLLEMVKELKKQKISVEVMKLRKIDFKRCDGCKGCDTAEKCHINDVMQQWYPKLLNADAWIIASPEYWWNVSGLCLNFLDRLNAYWLVRKKYFAGKKATILTCGGQPVERTGYAERFLKVFFKNLHFKVVGAVRASAEHPNEVKKQAKTMNACRNLGKKMAKMLKQQLKNKKTH